MRENTERKGSTERYAAAGEDFYSKVLAQRRRDSQSPAAWNTDSLQETDAAVKEGRQSVLSSGAGSAREQGILRGDYPAWRTMEHTLRTENEIRQDLAYIKKYIRLHLAEELDRTELARKLCLTPNYFSTVFKKHENESVGKFIERNRMERGAYYLVTEASRVQDIAHRTGFRDVSYFCRVFKKYYGVTPLRYRKMHRRIFSGSARRPDGNRVKALW